MNLTYRQLLNQLKKIDSSELDNPIVTRDLDNPRNGDFAAEALQYSVGGKLTLYVNTKKAPKEAKRFNHLVDIGFSVEGPWEKFEDIPFEAMMEGLKKRVVSIAEEGDMDAFGDCCDSYEIES